MKTASDILGKTGFPIGIQNTGNGKKTQFRAGLKLK